MSQIYKSSTGGGGSGITTIAGDVGSITGTNVTVFSNNSTLQAGSTVLFSNSGTVSTLVVTDANNNTIMGKASGKATVTSSQNTGFGANVLKSITTALANSFFGNTAGQSITDGDGNCGFGVGSLKALDLGGENCGFGGNTLLQANSVNVIANSAFGTHALEDLLTGQYNLALGWDAGGNYTTNESSNIMLANPGVIGDQNTIRIGQDGSAAGFQNKAFMAGIVGNTVSNAVPVTIDTSTGQLGVGTTVTLSVAMNTTQTVAQNSLQQIIYDNVLVDSASGYSAGTYTIPSTGNYFVSIVGGFQTTVSFTGCDMFLNKNSGTFLLHLFPTTPSSGVTANNVSGSGIFSFTAGDTIQIDVFGITTGGANIDIMGIANGYWNIFSLYKVS